MRRFVNSPTSGECWGALAEILPPELRRRLVLFCDAEQPVWVAGGTEDERHDVVHWLHEHGRTHLGRLVELQAEDIGEDQEDWLALRSVLQGPAESGSDVSAVCIHDADLLSAGSLRLVLGALDELESCEAGLGAPRLIVTAASNPDDHPGDEAFQHLMMRLDVLHLELPDPLAPLGASAGARPRERMGASTPGSTRPTS